MIPVQPEAKEAASKAAGMLVAHITDDTEAFQATADLFATCGEMHHGLIMLATTLSTRVAELEDRDPVSVLRDVALVYQRETVS